MDKKISMKESNQASNREEVKGGGEVDDKGNSKYYPEFLRKATHPGICLWHMLFKVAAIV
eukprot:CAMPEP_0168332636 /NCGR_PEP_ID=MMETSP0213-20121227/9082_1 /TAXON_ID=151035 /ORGANISM="Euplotes harpa, Strain FSP1.4" /LENGTH=59 /DNA_ID=CAMNT_0008336711 /DNA_START=19 /DNA_END=198 /DNA_ORIENTATION=-